MKRLLSALALLLVLGSGAAAVYLFQKQHRVAASAESAAEYLPAETQLLLSVPDIEGTVSDWKTTDLYKIWAEPEVQDFLARPLAKIPPHQELDQAWGNLLRVAPTNAFVAVTSVDPNTSRVHGVAGFNFRGEKADVEKLLAGAKDALRKQSPAGKADLVEYQGHGLETFDDGNGTTVASVYLDHRYLVSNDLGLLKATIDRLESRVPASASAATLAQDNDFKTVLAKLPPAHASLTYVRPQEASHRFYDLLKASGQTVDESRRAELEKIKAVGATTAIESGKLRDTVYVLAPGMNLDLAKLRMDSRSLSSPTTLLYAAAMFNLPTKIELPTGQVPAGNVASGFLLTLQQLGNVLQGNGITLERFRKAFGQEASLQLDWPPDRAQPAFVATVDIRDATAAKQLVDDLTKTCEPGGTWEVSSANGLTYHVLTDTNLSYVSPTITLNDKHLIVGLEPSGVREAADRERTGSPGFTANEAYKNTSGMVAIPNVAFLYLDTPALFERVYGTVRGVALLGAALLYPQISAYVDLAKLPNAATVSKHLSPTVFSENSDSQGSLLDSVGSFALGEAALAVVGTASIATFSMLQNHTASSFDAPAPVTAAVSAHSRATVSPAPQEH